VPLRLDHLARLPEEQRACLFWEATPVSRARLDREEAIEEKEAWVSTVLREWGSCGRVILVEDQPVAFALFAPPQWLPGAESLPTSPSSPDAVVLATVWVAPEHRGGGLGRILVQGVARDLVERGQVAIEAYGDTRGQRGCVAPADFWAAVGFKTQRPHVTTPRMRMELRSALSWKDEVELALEKVLSGLRPAKQKAARPIGSARTASQK
jgi:GNAT superfamily N-acetyltransferase